MKKDSGIITVEFLISLILASVFCIILFAVTMTFTVVEISQYMAFSSSRAYMAGHITMSDQERLARNKFSQFLGKPGNPVLLPLFKNGWYELSAPDIRGGGPGGNTFASDYGSSGNDNAYTGLRLKFTAKLLTMNFAILGSTSPNGNGFDAYVTGLLIREPTTQECQQQLKTENRFRAILDLDPRFNNYRSSSDKYVPMEDNGC
jgi:hypothetical protein